jgi:hypothetical protein
VARVTFQKRQKEMKRQEKQRMKAERRAQKKTEKPGGPEVGTADDLMPPSDFEMDGYLNSLFPTGSETTQ